MQEQIDILADSVGTVDIRTLKVIVKGGNYNTSDPLTLPPDIVSVGVKCTKEDVGE